MVYDRRSVGRQGPSKLANKGRGVIGGIWYVILWTSSMLMVLGNERIQTRRGILGWNDNRDIRYSMAGRLGECFKKVLETGSARRWRVTLRSREASRPIRAVAGKSARTKSFGATHHRSCPWTREPIPFGQLGGVSLNGSHRSCRHWPLEGFGDRGISAYWANRGSGSKTTLRIG
jgi:hypothetical protein